MKLIASAPGKVVLFGEWAVLEGGPGIAMAVAPRLKVSWTLPEDLRDDATMMIRGDSQIAAWDPQTPCEKQLLIPAFLTKTVKLLESLMFLDSRSERNLRRGGLLVIERDWPLSEGLGSSSAIVAAVMELVAPDRERLEKWQLGRETIRRAQGGFASGLDLAAQLRGSTVSLVQDRPRPLNLDIPEELVFLHAGEKADTTNFLKEQRVPLEGRKKLGESAAKFLEKRNWCLAMDEHAEVLSSCDVWPKKLREVRTEWIKSGLVHSMKSCGAGGGDTWMIWCPPSNQESLRAESEKLGWKVVSAQLSTEGTRKENS